tara:strand:- start:1221 stop:2576 length:1356 start_codon:yes stop_codon:yes gene_type:complete
MKKNNFLNQLRYSAFWALDAAKGGKIKTDLTDIEHSFSLDSFELLRKKNEVPLRKLLDNAANHSLYYTNLKDYETLSDFPVVNKNIVKSNLDNLLIRHPGNGKLHTIFTSGSTGTPFTIKQTQRKRNRNTADTLFFAKRAGFTLGDKLLYVRLWSKNLKKGKIPSFLQNIEQIDVEELETGNIKHLLKKLQNDKSPKGWLGYPSALEKICDYLDSIKSKPLDCNIKSIIGMSENLPRHVRSRMWYYFNTPMVSRYSNFENGIIAQQDMDSEYFVVNWASYIVEILDFEKDEPAKNGELGRIVVTDLYNHATPMIRYDTGDVGIMSTVSTHPFPILEEVDGRKTDILMNTDGEMISPYAFMGILPKFSEINQVQYLQTGPKEYTIKLNVDSNFCKQKEKEFLKVFTSLVGNSAEVTVHYVNEIPLLNSKKRRITRNLLAEEQKKQKETSTTI